MWFCIDENGNVAMGSTEVEAWTEYERKFDEYPMHRVRLYNVTNVKPNRLVYTVVPVEA